MVQQFIALPQDNTIKVLIKIIINKRNNIFNLTYSFVRAIEKKVKVPDWDTSGILLTTLFTLITASILDLINVGIIPSTLSINLEM